MPLALDTVDCIPSEGFSHSIGSVRSAPDGTLWVGSGDASSFNFVDELALRTYDTQSMAGKIMHIDRNGNGLTGHPFCPANNGCSTSGSGSHGAATGCSCGRGTRPATSASCRCGARRS